MRRFFILMILVLHLFLSVNAEPLKAGISVVEALPDNFFGSWRVVSKIDKMSGGSVNFRPHTVDIWNLSRKDDVIILNNPFTGASASVKLEHVEGNIIRFVKVGDYDNKKLTDTVDIKLDGDKFTGINSLKLETFSTYDNSLIKTDTAIYILRGEKISGALE